MTSLNLSFLCANAGGGEQPWGDPSYELGTGGSEECVIALSRELAKLGHRVRIYNNCGDMSGSHNGVTYIPWEHRHVFPIDRDEDLVCAWRQPALLEHVVARQRWDYDHNAAIGIHVPTKYQLQFIDRMVFLNSWHLEQYVKVGVPREKCINLGTAVDMSVFDQKVERIPGRVIAFFHPKRGLDLLRQRWGRIKAQVPHATLAQFWWEDKYLAEYPAREDGILPMQHLGPREIAAEILKAEVFGYPATGTETAPLTCIKAMAGGAIPVVVPVGGIAETLGRFGVQTTHPHFAGDLANLLGDTMTQQVMRGEMMATTRARYSWRAVAERWTQELTKELV